MLKAWLLSVWFVVFDSNLVRRFQSWGVCFFSQEVDEKKNRYWESLDRGVRTSAVEIVRS